MGAPAPAVGPAQPAWAEPGQAFEVSANGRPAGIAGEIAHALLKACDCSERLWFAEVQTDALIPASPARATTTAPSQFPPVKRDLSILVNQQTPFAEINEAIRAAGAPLAARVELIDRYAGKGIPSGQYSLTFSLEYRDSSRTLTQAEADAVHARILDALRERFGAQLR